MASKSRKKATTVQMDNDPEYLKVWKSPKFTTTSQTDFNHVLSNSASYAWANRASERPLYALVDYIMLNVCSTIQPPGYPESTLNWTPQALFGVRTPPAKHENGETEKIDKRRLYPEQTPDATRTIICSGKAFEDYESILVDFYEMKALNTPDKWDTDEAREAALEAILGFMEQVYTQAMSALAHNLHWDKVYATLIIGVYFSQFVWTRPEEKIKRPLRVIPVNRVLNQAEAAKVTKRYNEKIAEYKSREMPQIEFYNAPMLDFKIQKSNQESKPQPVSVSGHYRYAVRTPLREEHKGCKFQNSWLSPPARKPAGALPSQKVVRSQSI
ncbi:hypothetical protein C8Q76DRAFT_819952 [Earliella scabrosa]|nr:hypothetical protein C8Q76DRAFT_819952 [Earliella scabrosa]